MGADFFFCTFVIGMKPRVVLPVQALLVVGLLSAGLHAQSVGIGTSNPHPSARLHISDNARGLLIPNVALDSTTDVTTVSSPATSLLVYNTKTAGTGVTAVSPGFYYWNGSKWVRLAISGAGGGNAWRLRGNSGTDPAVNFLGTTDNNSLRIRVNDQQTFQFNTNFSIQRDDGGNARGSDAVDLQRSRSAATQVASGDYSVIGGGQDNTASGPYATVRGGLGNIASDASATIGGGAYNTASAPYATVIGGDSNTASGAYATVRGGLRDTASGDYATVGGGSYNTANGDYATVGGGSYNTANGAYATVIGGDSNTASGDYATVRGGLRNTASAPYATVSGGAYNTASAPYATVSGGAYNTASDTGATVSGGAYNTASGRYAIVIGGDSNTASGKYSVVLGGHSNTANGDFNLVFGENVNPPVPETHRVYFFSPTNSGFLVINRDDGDHPIHVGTNSGNGRGAYLSTGGVWMSGSSRSFKERFVQYRPAEVLEKIRQLPVEGYFYKGTEEYHITPMAEDFYRLFGTGVREIIETDSMGQLVRRPNPDVDKYLAASDVAGVALLGIQALREKNAQLRQRVSDLERENAALRARSEQLEALVRKIASTQTSP